MCRLFSAGGALLSLCGHNSCVVAGCLANWCKDDRTLHVLQKTIWIEIYPLWVGDVYCWHFKTTYVETWAAAQFLDDLHHHSLQQQQKLDIVCTLPVFI